jgi:hypothetical protein
MGKSNIHTQYLTHNNMAYFLYILKKWNNLIMKELLFLYVLFDYILVIFKNEWNYKHNSALYIP